VGAGVAGVLGLIVLATAIIGGLAGETEPGAFVPAVAGIVLGNVINLSLYSYFLLDFLARRFRLSVPVSGEQLRRPVTIPVIVKIAAVVVATGVLPFGFIVLLFLSDMNADVTVTLPGIIFSTYVSISVLIAFSRSLSISSDLLLATAERIERGDYGTETPLIANDEFAALSTAFNRASRTLRERDAEINSLNEQLRSINRRLEATVQERTEELREQKRKAEDVSEHRRDLIHVLSHDLRNPLSAVQSLLQLTGSLGDSLDTYRESIRESLDSAMELIDNVRQLQALETGRMQLAITAVPLRDAVDGAYRLLAHRFRDKDLELVNAVPEDLVVAADATTLRNTVIANLLSNAAKFSYEGSPVSVSTERDSRQVKLRVTDWGMGVPSSLLPHMFAETGMTQRKGTSGESGTGFGMPLVRRVVEAYGGEISAYSPAIVAPRNAEEVTAREDGLGPGTTIELSLAREHQPRDGEVTTESRNAEQKSGD